MAGPSTIPPSGPSGSIGMVSTLHALKTERRISYPTIISGLEDIYVESSVRLPCPLDLWPAIRDPC